MAFSICGHLPIPGRGPIPRTTFAFILGWLLAGIAVAQVPTDNRLKTEQDEAVHAVATAFFNDACHVGLSIATYDGGAVSFYNYGTVAKDRPKLATRRTLYEIGSVTKTFTGAIASRALLDSKVSLDGDYRTHLREPYPNLEKNGKPITLRSLIAHTAGLPRSVPDTSDLFDKPDFETLPFKLVEREKAYDEARYLRELHGVALATEPGQQFAYSNIGPQLAAFGLQNVYRKSFADLVRDFITRPLGMTRTGLAVRRGDRRLLAQPYGVSGKPVPYHLPNAGASGGLYSNSEDMIRYAAWHLDEKNPVIRTSHELVAGSLAEHGRAMGWNVATSPEGERKIWQSGGVFGMSSQVILFPDAQAAYVLLANDGCFNTQSELEKIALAVHAGRPRGRKE